MLPVKFTFLKRLPVVIVNAPEPAFTVRLTLLIAVQLTVEAVTMFLVNPPPLVLVLKPPLVDISRIVAPKLTLVRAIFAEPKVTPREVDPLEKNIGTLRVFPFKLIVPAVKVNVLFVVHASASVTVVPEPLTVTTLTVFPLLVNVDVAINVGLNDV